MDERPTKEEPGTALEGASFGPRVYVQKQYWVGTLGPLLVLGALLAVTLARLANGEATRLDRLVLFIIPIVLLVNIVGMRQPRRIIDTPTSLTFEGMGRRFVTKWSEMTALKVREFAFTDRVFIRIEPSSFLAGAIWVDMGKYPGFAELRLKLLAKERELHPDRVPYQKKDVKKRTKKGTR